MHSSYRTFSNDRYSRQLHSVGEKAMNSLFQCSVLVHGMAGVGSEVAKNLVLMGIKQITLQDSHNVSPPDLSNNILLTAEDVKNERNRAVACAQCLRQVNPDVSVHARTNDIEQESDLNYLSEYHCVIFTEASIDQQVKVNEFCRSKVPPIKFISAGVIGVLCFAFCDFGENHIVCDKGGEQSEVFIGNIEIEGDILVIHAAEGRKHCFETGDIVQLDYITGLDGLNGKCGNVIALTPFKFEVKGITHSDIKGKYVRGGVCRKMETSTVVCFDSLKNQLWSPSISAVSCSEQSRSYSMHLAMLTLSSSSSKIMVPVGSYKQATEQFISAAKMLSKEHNFLDFDSVNKNVLECAFLTSEGQLQPLVALIGGIASQEAMKALTGKYMPIVQWFYFDAMQLAKTHEVPDSICSSNQEQHQTLCKCVGDNLVEKLVNSNVFVAGCSSVGCEMLKNLAMLGAASSKGKISIADGDVVEKCNLSSQFLFQNKHVGQLKSVTASEMVKQLNSSVNTECFHHYVQPDTDTLFSDDIFKNQKVVVCSLDTVEARRYLDKRCIQNSCSMIDIGIDGCKGHVQVIIPFLTESYTSQPDPDLSRSYPYCTITSFPYKIEHTIQWACEKFESMFTKKPQLFNEFWERHGSLFDVIAKLERGENLEGMTNVINLLQKRPKSWKDCVQLARLKFEKYFNCKALQLLHAFPADLQDKDGSLFWRWLKRPPMPLHFTWSDELHSDFILTAAKLLAEVWTISYSLDDLHPKMITSILSTTQVPQFLPKSNKKLFNEMESKKPNENFANNVTDDRTFCLSVLKEFAGQNQPSQTPRAVPLSFKKDDDKLGHLDFIWAASNLRAVMYGIPVASKLHVHFVAGSIVPSIPTTSSIIGALATIELMKVIKHCTNSSMYSNAFLNLSEQPCLILSQPRPPERTDLGSGVSFTLWDYCEIKGNPDMILEQFLTLLMEKIGLNPSMVVHGTKMLWVSMMPGHAKRKATTMVQLIQPRPFQQYVELTVAFETSSGDEVMGPRIRYVFME